MSFQPYGSALTINIVIKVNGVNFTKFNFTEIEIAWAERPVIVIHKALSSHFSNLIIKSIDCALSTTVSQGFFVLQRIFELVHVMVII